MKILVVEDSAATRHLVRRLLEQAEMGEVLEAGNGAQALDLLRSEQVDVVLSDLNMTPMDGRQLLHEVRTLPCGAQIPFILMTGNHCPDAISNAVGDGRCQYLPKPFGAAQLLNAVDRARH